MNDSLALIGLDWSGARLSAWAYDEDGEILSSTVMHEPDRVAPSEYLSRVRFHLSEWLGGWPEVPVIVAGDVGVLTGNDPKLTLPVPLSALPGALLPCEGMWVVPWISQHAPPDLSCGSEVILSGLGEDHAAVCIAGRHTRHYTLEHGRVVRLSTEITSEMRDLLLTSGPLSQRDGPAQAFEPRLFQEWVERGLDTEKSTPVFAVQAAIHAGQLDPAFRAAALTGLLIGADVARHYEPGDEVLLVADGPLKEAYGLALDALGADVDETSATEALQDGLFELADLAGLLGEG